MVAFQKAYRLLHLLPPEGAHRVAIGSLHAYWRARKFFPIARHADNPTLRTFVWGLNFPNPLGLAAGFDKQALIPNPLLSLGFGFVEIGTVTPRPQSGNRRKRLFRLTEDEAIINRMGFNSHGLLRVARRLASRDRRMGIVGANIGRNKETTNIVRDYEEGVEALAPLVNYVVINISSPNTPRLREMQRWDELPNFIERLKAARAKAVHLRPPPLLLKISPDLEESDVQWICNVALSSAIDGIVISNTTTRGAELLRSRDRDEEGGLSGKPLFGPSTALLAKVFAATEGKIPLVGVGGVFTGEDAYKKIRAGASLVQILTSFVFEGPGVIDRIKRGLEDCLKRDGFASVADAVGSGVNLSSKRKLHAVN